MNLSLYFPKPRFTDVRNLVVHKNRALRRPTNTRNHYSTQNSQDLSSFLFWTKLHMQMVVFLHRNKYNRLEAFNIDSCTFAPHNESNYAASLCQISFTLFTRQNQSFDRQVFIVTRIIIFDISVTIEELVWLDILQPDNDISSEFYYAKECSYFSQNRTNHSSDKRFWKNSNTCDIPCYELKNLDWLKLKVCV